MRYFVCGGTGFIGRHVVEALLERGDEVLIITRRLPPPSVTRRHPRLRYATWKDWAANPEEWGRADGIVNLAGETINQRWTKEAKQRILLSRTQSAQWIADTLPKMPEPPRVVVGASGIAIYGHTFSTGEEDLVFDESSPPHPQDFLGHVTVAWEQAADAIPAERVVKLRLGLVLDRKDGVFPLLARTYRCLVGGRFGSGRQGFPWIHIQDVVGLILFCLERPEISGPVNAVAPDPVTADGFGRTLGRVLDRPHWFHVPGWLARMALGERSVLLLTGQLARPRKALEAGYTFRFPTLRMALRDLTRRTRGNGRARPPESEPQQVKR